MLNSNLTRYIRPALIATKTSANVGRNLNRRMLSLSYIPETSNIQI